MVGSMVMVVHALDNAEEDNKVGVDNFQKKLMSSICFVLFTFFTKFRQALFSHATRTALDIPSGSVITVKSDKTIGFSV